MTSHTFWCFFLFTIGMQGTDEPGCGKNGPVGGGMKRCMCPWCSHTSLCVSALVFHILCEGREIGGQGSAIEVTRDEEDRLGVRCLKTRHNSVQGLTGCGCIGQWGGIHRYCDNVREIPLEVIGEGRASLADFPVLFYYIINYMLQKCKQ